ncbi:MAG: hypothetical protein HY327_10340 [Chloroflexi bacterium]|nr:hypothetical protein [Chloroflexota bacterium]
MERDEWIKSERARRIVGFVGGYLIEMGVMTLEDLDRGLEEQLRFAAQGREMRLGEVLIQLGKVTPEQLKLALNQQSLEETRRLRRALEHAQKREKQKK